MITKQEAIGRVCDSLHTHQQWVDYYDRGGALEDIAGDRQHHIECIDKYNEVIEYLEST